MALNLMALNPRLSCHITLLALAFGLVTTETQAANPWPADAGVEIGLLGQPGHLPDDYEPSGAVWNAGRSRLLVVSDQGQISEMNQYGDSTRTWTIGGDLEAIAISESSSDLAYIGVERPDSVLEFDLLNETLTGNAWDLTNWMTSEDNQGLEALTIVDGLFYAGLQETGEMFAFQLSPGQAAIHVATIDSPLGLDDLSGLHYDAGTETLFAIYDDHDRIVEMTANGALVRDYELAGNDQEGIALIGGSSSGSTTIFLAEDAEEVWRYEGYPIEAPVSSTPPGGLKGNLVPTPRCHPDPWNDSVTIRFDLADAGPATLTVHNVLGRHLRTFAVQHGSAGQREVTWDGRDDRGRVLASGAYFVRLSTQSGARTVQTTLIR